MTAAPAPVLVLIALACGKASPAGPVNFSVAYSLTSSGPIIVDSVRYDDGHGTFITVASPSGGWTQTLTAMSGGSVQAQAWVVASGPGSAKLKASWTNSGVSTQADSSFALPVAAQNFTLSIPHHTL